MFRSLRPAQFAVDVAIAAVFGVLALYSEIGSDVYDAMSVLGSVITCVALTAALSVRRLAPELALGVAWFAAIAQMSFGRPPIFADLAIFAVLYAVAAYGTRVGYWLGFASAVVGALVITLYLLLIPEFAGGRLQLATLPLAAAVLVAAMFALLLSWVTGALVRMALRAQTNRRAQQLAEGEAAAEQERVRIARDMHDVVAHSLAVVIAQADGARYAAASDPAASGAATSAALETISSTARAALTDVRVLLTQLRRSDAAGAQPPLETQGPQPSLTDLEGLYAQVRAAGIDLRVDVDPAPPGSPPAAVQLAVYRILQEALTNALRHGDGAPVSVRLAWLAHGVDLEVRNAVSAPVSATGHGLIGMRERAQLVAGQVEAAAVGGDFVVHAFLPIGGAV